MGNYLEKAMGMSDAVWDRHTNPWSGWSRMAIPILFAMAIWSRTWIGWWSLLIISLVVVWTWLNPRVFPVPTSAGNWMSQAVLGERIWLDRKNRSIPAHHTRVPAAIAIASGLGLIPLAGGLWQYNVWAVVTGLGLIIGGKLWFLDRMVWLRYDTSDIGHRKAETGTEGNYTTL